MAAIYARVSSEQGKFDDAIARDHRLRRDRDGLSTQALSALQEAYSKNASSGYFRKLRELLLPKFRTNPIGWHRLAEINAYLGDKEEAFRWLQKAYDEHTDWIPFLKVDPTLDPFALRSTFSGTSSWNGSFIIDSPSVGSICLSHSMILAIMPW
jgi:tetratricopeptide (TPR) repeat protein